MSPFYWMQFFLGSILDFLFPAHHSSSFPYGAHIKLHVKFYLCNFDLFAVLVY